MQALSQRNRLIGLVGAVEAGFGFWYLTNGRWINGAACAIGVAFLLAVYLRRERKLKRQDGGRRY